MPPPRHSLLAALGFPPDVARLYEHLLRTRGVGAEELAVGLGRTREEVELLLAPLREAGIVTEEDGSLHAVPPAEAVGRILSETAAGAQQAHRRLMEIAAALPHLAGTSAQSLEGALHDVEPIDGEVSSGGNVPGMVADLIRDSSSDLCWLRPDQWALPWEDQMAALIAEVVSSGRRSRAIYPVRILSEAPSTVMARSLAGEEIRVLPELPTRMLVIGTTHAIIPEPLGYTDTPRTLIRQRGPVETCLLLFEELWARAEPVDGLERIEVRPELRRFLVEQLASGAQDEIIARRLGVSLRTVRRRVAELMSELGAESRFQAGVEAARRGWI